MYLGPPRWVAINRSTSPIMQTIAADPIEMKESAAMTCPTKRRNSPIASHFGEKASPQRVGAPATGPPNPKQARPKQKPHQNHSSTNRRTGPAQPWPALPLHPTTGISARSVRRFGVRCSERARHCSCMEPSTESLTVLGP